MDPLPVSPYDNGDASFQIVAVSALEVYPEAKVVPGLMIANTDTKHYASLAARWVQPLCIKHFNCGHFCGRALFGLRHTLCQVDHQRGVDAISLIKSIWYRATVT